MTIDIETAAAGTYGNATEADLHRLVSLINEDNEYLILHRKGDERFAQAALQRRPDASFAPGYVVEYSLKSGKIRQTSVDTPEQVYVLLAGWAFDRPGWKGGQTWTTLSNDWFIDIRGSCATTEDERGVTLHFPLFALDGTGATRDAAFAALLDRLTEHTRDSAEARLEFAEWAKDHLKQVKRAATP